MKNGTLKGTDKSGDYELGNTSIKALNNGWYELTLEAKVTSDNVSVVFGPTNGENWNARWEWGVKNNVEAIIDISSIELSKIEN